MQANEVTRDRLLRVGREREGQREVDALGQRVTGRDEIVQDRLQRFERGDGVLARWRR